MCDTTSRRSRRDWSSAGVRTGTVLRLVCDDTLAAVDVPNFCREDGHALIATDDAGGVLSFYIAKA